jgi:hypothetical protein
VPLNWDDKSAEAFINASSRSTSKVNLTGWSKSLEVTGDGQGIVSHAGLALLRQLAGKTGLTGGLSRALASPRLLIHDRGTGRVRPRRRPAPCPEKETVRLTCQPAYPPRHHDCFTSCARI